MLCKNSIKLILLNYALLYPLSLTLNAFPFLHLIHYEFRNLTNHGAYSFSWIPSSLSPVEPFVNAVNYREL